MKKLTASVLFALMLALAPAAAAESAAANESDLFFTQSDGETEEIDRSVHPVVWIFVALGVGSVVCIGVLTYANRRDRM